MTTTSSPTTEQILLALRVTCCAECRFHFWIPKDRDEVSGAMLPSKWVCLFNLNIKEHNGKCSAGIRKEI